MPIHRIKSPSTKNNFKQSLNENLTDDETSTEMQGLRGYPSAGKQIS